MQEPTFCRALHASVPRHRRYWLVPELYMNRDSGDGVIHSQRILIINGLIDWITLVSLVWRDLVIRYIMYYTIHTSHRKNSAYISGWATRSLQLRHMSVTMCQITGDWTVSKKTNKKTRDDNKGNIRVLQYWPFERNPPIIPSRIKS